MRAVVDIGSNSIKFALADFKRNAIKVVDKGSWITRLGRGLTQTKLLDPEALSESQRALSEIKARLGERGKDVPTIVVATSAVRDCGNPEKMQEIVKNIFAIPLRILSGVDEARLSMSGAQFAGDLIFGSKELVFVDVGGASTEVGRLHPQFQAHSFQAGAVRCHENLGLDKIPVSDEAWKNAHLKIGEFFPAEDWQKLPIEEMKNNRGLVAVGGSLVVAAKVSGARKMEDLGYLCEFEQLFDLNERLRKLSLEERLKIPSMEAGRADILCAGILCLLHVASKLEARNFAVTTWGLRHGILRNWDELISQS